MSLGSTLRNRREEMHLTQSMVSIRIGGITHQAVGNWESNLSIPTDGHITQLAEILQLDEGLLRQMAVEARDRLRNETGWNGEARNRNPEQAVKDSPTEDPLSSLLRGIRGLFR